MKTAVISPEWDYCVICKERPVRPKMLTCSPECGKEIQRRQAEDHKDKEKV